eukprot:CAMPEP_0113939200 /NCGR_PEP_ID=MMETSP1339-20121228/5545_1 /TAXON_ID=94617 /ORGANISM="Fibrocapsa japonica" /LENGTH=2332 /DNA_ID=CAMNT_0000942633 /DNA_START=63 /DNA_END=7061 /DNA_ORIENTATION=- /assembly_acc=CAM_ASM_000762
MSGPNFQTLEEYVESRGGNRVIKKVLIANNGIGAVKAIRSIRRWAYEMFENERAVQFVVMATPEDMKANAEYIRMADEVVDVPGGSNNNNYANVMLIVEIAERWQVDAVWAGWGHASENPHLPDSLAKTERKIVFIGPSGPPMRALGDKIGSTIIAQSAGVPCIAWNGDGLEVDYQAAGGVVPDEVYSQANVTTAEQAESVCERIGFPVMIKASEGGGGKGIRKVLESKEVAAAYRQVQGEIPGSPIFVMKLAPQSRHLEVQLICDTYGNAIALNGRDCSVQRRHQKIIEEGPPLAASPEDWKKMEQAAVNMAKEVGYANAGTVEYLFTVQDKKFYFLELNPRLQVEHPVTEMITKVNLPASQLQVAMGLPLHNIPDIRALYGRDYFGTTPIDFDKEERMPPHGHCIAVRITAENPDTGFQPTSGLIEELNFRSTPQVWGYFSVNSSGLVHEFADSQFGHLFAAGQDREAARKNMVLALKELSIRGNIRTTVEYIVKMMHSEQFISNQIDTAWLDGRIARKEELEVEESNVDPVQVVVVGATILSFRKSRTKQQQFVGMIEKGQVPPKTFVGVRDDIELIYQDVKYCLKVSQSGPITFTVECNGSYVQSDCRALSDGGYLVNLGGKSRPAYLTEEATGQRLIFDNNTCIFTKEYDPTRLTAEVAGKLVRSLVPDGEHVKAGEPFAEVEVMKMFMPLTAPESGVISWKLSEGAALLPGDLMANLALDNPDSVTRAEVFSGKLESPSLLDAKGLEGAPVDKAHLRIRKALETLETVMEGYNVPDDQYKEAIGEFSKAVTDPRLPLYEFEEQLSVLSGRIDGGLYEQLKGLADDYSTKLSGGNAPVDVFPVNQILPIISQHIRALPEQDRASSLALVDSLRRIAEQYSNGVAGRTVAALLILVRHYLNVERHFSGVPFERALRNIRKEHSGEPEKVFEMCRSHNAISSKNSLLQILMEDIAVAARVSREHREYGGPDRAPAPVDETTTNWRLMAEGVEIDAFVPVLTEISMLHDKKYHSVALYARKLLIEQSTPSIEGRRLEMNRAVTATISATSGSEADRLQAINTFIEKNVPIRDCLLHFLKQQGPMDLAAMEIYVRKIYATHEIKDLSGGVLGGNPDLTWTKWSFLTRPPESLPTAMAPGLTKSASFGEFSSGMKKTRSSSQLMGRDSYGGNESDMSTSDLEGGYTSKIPANVVRHGVMLKCRYFKDLESSFGSLLELYPEASASGPVNALHIAVLEYDGPTTAVDMNGEVEEGEDPLVSNFRAFLAPYKDDLNKVNIRRVTFFCSTQGASLGLPGIYTYRTKTGFKEDSLFRHIEPPLAFHLDLVRLTNFHIKVVTTQQTQNGNVHLYEAMPRKLAAAREGLDVNKVPLTKRYFARVVTITSEYIPAEAERMFVESLNALTLAIDSDEQATVAQGRRVAQPSNNHIFLNVVSPNTVLEPANIAGLMRKLMTRYQSKITRLGVAGFEVKLVCRFSQEDTSPVPLRLIASNPTGFVLRVDTYVEVKEGNRTVFRTVSGEGPGDWEGRDCTAPYQVSRPHSQKRAQAMASSDTLYCYDWLELFEEAVAAQWQAHSKERPSAPVNLPATLLTAHELVVFRKDDPEYQDSSAPATPGADTPMVGTTKPWEAKELDNLEIRRVLRSDGQNDVGMVAWDVTLFTPEYPAGRRLVLICNDITFQAGSFGTREDAVFFLASKYARERGIPRLYLAANSGARIGMSNSVKSKFKVCWLNEEDPSQGFKYLYLEKDDYEALAKKSAVICQEGEMDRMIITDIVGSEPDLGVENLSGSGLIAGETSKAYEDIFTLTLVVGRSVGIGAYLVRLGQRTIQKETESPIILTGYQALNKLMGRELYQSNDQLGGAGAVMGPNGVTHVVVENHMEVVTSSLKWLSYVPSVKGGYLPILDITGTDMVEREVSFMPPSDVAYDPRHLLTGHTNDLDGTFHTGFFDKGSFTEYMPGWAKTVVVGRARLGGIPMGVIVTENRTMEHLMPADPADQTSMEKISNQAGCVWFPDSSYKTATAIRDFGREELPLIIFANWRGFSGGQRDMFNEVLKFGSMIVDAFVEYKQPIFVYIPPYAEVRGGAWVVVDSQINSATMEMYAANHSRGGVLEANGAASIKFRVKDQLAAAHRLDPVLKKLDAKLKADAAVDASPEDRLTEDQRSTIQREIKEREGRLKGVYQQIAVQFADLHDTPGRMQATGVVLKEVQWAAARSFFYWRLRRRLAEFDLCNRIRKADSKIEQVQAAKMVKQWFVGAGNEASSWDDNKAVLSWMAQAEPLIHEKLEEIQMRRTGQALFSALEEGGAGAVQMLSELLSQPGAAELKASLLEQLQA